MRIVLDTNVLVSGLLHSQGNPGQVLALALAGARPVRTANGQDAENDRAWAGAVPVEFCIGFDIRPTHHTDFTFDPGWGTYNARIYCFQKLPPEAQI